MNRRFFLQMLGAVPVFSIIRMNKSNGMTANFTEVSASKVLPTSDSKSLAHHVFKKAVPGDLIMIGSRPSMGKSAVTLNLIHDLSLKQKKSVAYISYEQSENEVMQKLICIDTGFSHGQLKSENFGGNEIMKLANSCDKFAKSKLFVSDRLLKAEDLKSKLPDNLDFIVVDYLQIIPSDIKYKSRADQVAGVIDQLKSLAQEKNAIVVAVSQLNRGVESRSNRRPIPDDIRETRHLKPVDHMFLIYREDYYSSLDNKSIGPAVDIEIIKFGKNLKCDGTLVAKFNKQTLQVSLSDKTIS